jgi:hypothetical protein
MPASTDQVEMPGAAFVPVCVKVHGSSLPRKRWRTLIQSAIAKTVPSGFGSRLPLEGDETRRPIAFDRGSQPTGCGSFASFWFVGRLLPVLPLETDIVRAVAMSQNCRQAIYRQGNVLSGCKPIHIPQSAAAVSFDLKSRRLRSRFESSALFSTWSFENSDCSDTQTLILNSRRACCEPAGEPY